MGSMIDYLDWRGDLTFSQSPFNEIDNLILSQLVYINFDYIVPSVWTEADITIEEAAEQYFHKYTEEQIQASSYVIRISVPLLKKLAKCPRFAKAKLSKFDNIIDFNRIKQFAAMHIELDDGSLFISYRGTDNTIIGWKENFNMTIQTPVPAQFEALRYLEETALNNEKPLRLGGHSKGGNLAVYAAVMSHPHIKEKIIEIYNNDGPGFEMKITKSEAYQTMLSKIRTIVPQSSIVGMLLEHEEEYIVVKSNQSLFMQHDAFSWEVLGASFVRANQVEKKSEMLDVTIKSWLEKMDKKQREQFVSAIFHLFEAADIWTFNDFTRAKWKTISTMIRALNASQENKVILTRTLKLLFHEGKNVFFATTEKKSSSLTKNSIDK